MSFMDDPSLPPPEEGIAERILTPGQAIKCLVRVTVTPHDGSDPIVKSFPFPSTTVAREFVEMLEPPPAKQTGSPKQAHARKVRNLRIDANLLAQSTISYDIVAAENVIVPRAKPRPSDAAERDAARARSANTTPLSSGPPGTDLRGLVASGPTLPLAEAEFPEVGGEAEDSGPDEGAEA